MYLLHKAEVRRQVKVEVMLLSLPWTRTRKATLKNIEGKVN